MMNLNEKLNEKQVQSISEYCSEVYPMDKTLEMFSTGKLSTTEFLQKFNYFMSIEFPSLTDIHKKQVLSMLDVKYQMEHVIDNADGSATLPLVDGSYFTFRNEYGYWTIYKVESGVEEFQNRLADNYNTYVLAKWHMVGDANRK